MIRNVTNCLTMTNISNSTPERRDLFALASSTFRINIGNQSRFILKLKRACFGAENIEHCVNIFKSIKMFDIEKWVVHVIVLSDLWIELAQ